MPPRRLKLDEIRPIAQQAPFRDGEELVLSLPGREVRLAGDPDLAARVLGRCDGERTVREIVAEIEGDVDTAAADDARGLIEVLLEQDALDDCASAWRHFHRLSSVGGGLNRPLSDDDVAALVGERYTPERLEDRTEPIRPRDTALLRAGARRSSARPRDGARRVGYEELSSVLAAMDGHGGTGHRRLPSAGAIYPLVVHLLVRRELSPLERGLWWLDAENGRLALVRRDRLEVDAVFLPHPVTDPLLSFDNPIVFVSADLERSSRKYSNRGYRFALMEAGAALGSAYLAGAELDLPVRGVGGVAEVPLGELLELRQDVEPLLAVLLGA